MTEENRTSFRVRMIALVLFGFYGISVSTANVNDHHENYLSGLFTILLFTFAVLFDIWLNAACF